MNKQNLHNSNSLAELENKIEYTFKNKEYLLIALTHTSYANELKVNKTPCYERSEFLGDAILEFIVSEYIFKKFPDYPEGKLTKLRASLVCEYTLSQVSKSLGYGDYVFLSKGEALTGGRSRNSIMCDLFESVLGAIYMDGGMDNARKYVHSFLLDDIETKSLYFDAKTTLQEYAQKQKMSLEYVLVSQSGPDHNKVFVSDVLLNGEAIARGTDGSVKHSEQAAAYNALLKLKDKQV